MDTWLTFLKLFVLFFIGNILGYIIETIFAYFKTGKFQIRKGLIYGPFIPVYGFGVLLFYFIMSITNKPISIFILSIIMGGFLEFICSWIQEKIFGSISWDYSGTFMNIRGRTNLQYCIYWGIVGLLLYNLYPLANIIDLFIISSNRRIIIYILMIFLAFDIIISCLACIRQNNRRNKVIAQNKIEILLDTYYPDELLDKIYNNRKWIK